MTVDCERCGESVSASGNRAYCQCGWRLDADCFGDRDGWCPDRGDEPWIGAVEF